MAPKIIFCMKPILRLNYQCGYRHLFFSAAGRQLSGLILNIERKNLGWTIFMVWLLSKLCHNSFWLLLVWTKTLTLEEIEDDWMVHLNKHSEQHRGVIFQTIIIGHIRFHFARNLLWIRISVIQHHSLGSYTSDPRINCFQTLVQLLPSYINGNHTSLLK